MASKKKYRRIKIKLPKITLWSYKRSKHRAYPSGWSHRLRVAIYNKMRGKKGKKKKKEFIERFLSVFYMNNMAQTNPLSEDATKTNTRTSRSMVMDHEGIYVHTEPGEISLDGARREHNLVVPSSNLNHVNWLRIGTYTTANYLDLGTRVRWNGIATASDTMVENSSAPPLGTGDRKFAATFRLRTISGTNKFRIKNTHGGVVDNYSDDLLATEDFQTFSFSVTNGPGAGTGMQIIGIRGPSDSSNFDLIVEWASLYDITSRTNPYPPEHVDSETDHGYGINGVKYFDTTNGNTEDRNIIDEAPGYKFVVDGGRKEQNDLFSQQDVSAWDKSAGVTTVQNADGSWRVTLPAGGTISTSSDLATPSATYDSGSELAAAVTLKQV